MGEMIRLQRDVSELVGKYEQDYLRPYGRELEVNLHRLGKIEKKFGKFPVLMPVDVEAFLKPLRTANRNRYRALLKAMLRWGVEMGYVTGDVDLKLFKAEKERGARTRRMSKDEEERLRAVMGGDLSDLFTAAVDTGIRYGALRQLRPSDVSGETLVVPADIQKHQSSQRIPLTKRLAAIVARRCGAIPAADWGTHALFTVPNFEDEWKRARKVAGVSNLHWHDLRGEFASRLSEAGVGVETISRLLGHATIAMTMRYLRPRVSQFDEAIRKLGL